MKKIVLSLAVVAAMFVSCKETATEADTTMDSVATEMEDATNEVIDETADAIDTAAVKVDETVEEVKEEITMNRPEGYYILIKGSNGIKLFQVPELL